MPFREEYIGHTNVLDKVKELILLPNTEFGTLEQVSNYYEVGKEAIETLVIRHKDELENDGYATFNKNKVIEMLNIPIECLTGTLGKSIATLEHGVEIEIPNRGLRLFPKRAILRVGMLLRDSIVAKEVRTRLLNIVQDTQDKAPKIIKEVANEIDEEKALMMKRISAEMDGDFDKVCVINAKLFALKNKRIAKLEGDIENITTHSLTLTESRTIINKLVRVIAMTKYNNLYGKAWNDLYKMINYKLGINIKARHKEHGKSYLTVLTKEETFKVEQIVRTWANATGLNVDDLLKIA